MANTAQHETSPRALAEALRAAFPHVAIAALPTPVEPFAVAEGVWIKRDDLTAEPYGGNKVRKLEFLLGQARAQGAKTIITYGAAGSNHALATAYYGRQHGFRCISMLVPQVNSHAVRRNLLFHFASGADIRCYANSRQVTLATALEFKRSLLRDGRRPFIIPPGGSSIVGMLGFVNAAFELKQQVDDGLLPAPDVIYVASGTMGTSVGLAVGFAALRWPVRIEAIRVATRKYSNMPHAHQFFHKVAKHLRQHVPHFPECHWNHDLYHMRHDYFGGEYARHTPEGSAAIARAAEAGIKLEGTYTGKALAALLGDVDAGALQGKNVLFWNTYNSCDFSAQCNEVEWHALPKGFHTYFTSPCQEDQTMEPLSK